ncbi:MAG TPA: hypothetical protein DCP69_02925 [Candidatus Omnitrophica bacterium]|nr:hypothetical protein [Candidatus Omnitrophota bacterium]
MFISLHASSGGGLVYIRAEAIVALVENRGHTEVWLEGAKEEWWVQESAVAILEMIPLKE